jgi:hypothetical protein
MTSKESNIVNLALAALGIYLVIKKKPISSVDEIVKPLIPDFKGDSKPYIPPIKPIESVPVVSTPITDLLPIAKPVEKIVTPVTPVKYVPKVDTPITDLLPIAKPIEKIVTPVIPVEDVSVIVDVSPTLETVEVIPSPKFIGPDFKGDSKPYIRPDNPIYEEKPIIKSPVLKVQPITAPPAVIDVATPIFEQPIYETIDVTPPPLIPEYGGKGDSKPYIPPFELPIFPTPIYTPPVEVAPPVYVPPFEQPIYSTPTDEIAPAPVAPPVEYTPPPADYFAPVNYYIPELQGTGGGESFWQSILNTQWDYFFNPDNISDAVNFDSIKNFESDQA